MLVEMKHKKPKPEKPLTVGRYRNILKKSKHWQAFSKFFASVVEPLDFATTNPEWKCAKNPKGIVRASLDSIQSQLAGVVWVAQANAECKPGQKKFRPPNHAPKLCVSRFLEHGLGVPKSPLYVCSNPYAKYKDGSSAFLFVVDVDNHDGKADDVQEVAGRINELLNVNLFWETSTGGEGKHGWALVKWDGDSSSYRKFTLDVVKKRIKELLVEEGFKAKVDIQGQPPIVTGFGWGRVYEKAGLLIKAPRFDSLESFESFFSRTPTLNKKSFDRLLGVAPSVELPTESYCDNRLSPFSEIEEEQEGFHSEKDDESDWSSLDRNNTSGGSLKTESLLKSGNPWLSSVGATLLSLQRYGVGSSWETACTLYETEGAATGARTSERESRFERLHEEIEKSFDPSKGKSDPLWFTSKDKEELVEVLRPLIREKGLKRVNIDDLAVVALLFRKSIIKKKGYVATEGLVAFFRAQGKTLGWAKLGRLTRILIDLRVISLCAEAVWKGPKSKDNTCRQYVWLLGVCSSEVAPSLVPTVSYCDNRLSPFSKRDKKESPQPKPEATGWLSIPYSNEDFETALDEI